MVVLIFKKTPERSMSKSYIYTQDNKKYIINLSCMDYYCSYTRPQVITQTEIDQLFYGEGI